MAGISRIVNTSFWTDGKVEEFTPEDKYFMLYLLTNPSTTQLGIYEISIKRAAYELGYSQDAVRALIERFECVHGMVIWSRETNEIAVKNFLRHSIIKGGAPVRDCLVKEMKAVKNKDLIARVFAHIKSHEKLNATVRGLVAEYEAKNGVLSYSNSNTNENEKDNDNENENENEVSYPDTTPYRTTTRSKRENTRDLFLRLLPDYVLSVEVKAKMDEWITYKTERREPYKEQGMKSLLRQVENNCHQYGDRAVCELIDNSMSNGWKGIIFDKLKEKPGKPYQKPTRADDLEDKYRMTADWSETT